MDRRNERVLRRPPDEEEELPFTGAATTAAGGTVITTTTFSSLSWATKAFLGILTLLLVASIFLIVAQSTPVWTNYVQSGLANKVSAARNTLSNQQQEINVLRREIATLPAPAPGPPGPPGPASSIATALRSNGTVLPIRYIGEGYILIRQDNQIIGVSPDYSFIVNALGYVPENRAFRGMPGGYASLDAGGMVPINQLPPQAFVHFYHISSASLLPTLSSAVVGDWAIVTNSTTNTTIDYVLSAPPPTDPSNWLLVNQGGAAGPNVYQLGGNSFGQFAVLGTLDAYSLQLVANAMNFILLNTTSGIVQVQVGLDVNGTARVHSLASALVSTDATGLLQNTALGPGLLFNQTTLSNTGVLNITSGSSGLSVTDVGNGLWNLLLNFNSTVAGNLTVVAGAGIATSTPTPTELVITNTGVLAIAPLDYSVIVQPNVNGTVYIGVNGSSEVTAVLAGVGIAVNASRGAVVVTNVGLINATAGAGIAVTTTGGTLNITNLGMLSLNSTSPVLSVSNLGGGAWTITTTQPVLSYLFAGLGISLNQTGSNVTITNTGVVSLNSTDGSITITSLGNGAYNLITNRSAEVSSIEAGLGITVNQTSGNVLVSNSGVVTLQSADLSVVITSLGSGLYDLATNRSAEVSSIEAGLGITVNQTSGNVLVTNSGVVSLQSSDLSVTITPLGSGLYDLITNRSAEVSSIEAGLGITVNQTSGNVLVSNSGVVTLQSADLSVVITSLGSGLYDLATNRSAEVSSIEAGLGITVNQTSGNVLVANSGVVSLQSSDLSVTITPLGTGLYDLITNRSAEVSSISAGPGITVNTTKGDVLVSNAGVIALESTDFSVTIIPLGGGLYNLLTNRSAEVASISAGLGITVNNTVGNVLVSNAGVVALQSSDLSVTIVSLGSGLYDLTTNRSAEVSSIEAGLGITVNQTSGNVLVSNSGVVTLQSADLSVVITSLGSGLYDLATNRSAEVSSIEAGLGITVNNTVGNVLVSNAGVVALQSSDLSVVIVSLGSGLYDLATNRSAEVSSIEAGLGITVNQTSGNVLVSNSGVVSLVSSDVSVAITYLGSGLYNLVTNRSAEVASISAGLGITVNNTVGNVLVSNAGVVALQSSDLSVVITSLGSGLYDLATNRSAEVSSIEAGLGITVNQTSGNVLVSNSGVVSLQSSDLSVVISSLGSGLYNLATNRSAEVASISAGLGITVNQTMGNILVSNSGVVSLQSSDLSVVITSLGSGLYNLATNRSAEVSSIEAGLGITVNQTSGNVLVSNSGVVSLQSSDLSVVITSLGSGLYDLATNRSAEVSSIEAGLGITVNQTSGNVLVSNSGVVSLQSSDLSVVITSLGSGLYNLATNRSAEVSSITAGLGITVNQTSGNVLVSNAGVVSLQSSDLSVVITSLGSGLYNLATNRSEEVSSVVAGLGITVNQTSGNVLVSNSGVVSLQSSDLSVVITSLGSGLYDLATNRSAEVSSITAGLGITVNQTSGNVLVSNSGVVSITSTTLVVANLGSGVWSITDNDPTIVAGLGINVVTNSTTTVISNTGVVSLQSSDLSVTITPLGSGLYNLATNRSAEVSSIVAGPGITVNQTSGNVLVSNSGVLSVAVTAPITNSGTATAPNIGLAASGVVAGSYTLTSLTVDTFGRITAASSGSITNTAWLLAGNTLAANATLGTLNNFDLVVVANNVEAIRVSAANHYVGVGTSTPAVHLDVNGSLRSSAVTVGPSSYATGTVSMGGTTTITGVGTTFTSAMVGGLMVFNGGTNADQSIMVVAFVSTTVLTGAYSATIASTNFVLYYGGTNAQSNGWISSTNSMLLGAVYDSTSPTPVAGTNGQVFTSSGTNAKWATISGGSGISVSAASTGITITNTGVVSVAVTAPITNSGTATAPNIGLAVSGVVAGSYTLTSLTVDTFGRITAASSGSITNTAWLLAGNTLAANATLGTLNNFDVVMITNNAEAMRLSAANHYVGIGTSTPAVHLDVNGGLRSSNHIVGPSSYATGTVSMSGTTTITGVGTTFTSAMVGGLLVFNGGANADQSIMVVAFVSTTVLTGAYTATIASTNFVLYYGGVYSQSTGWFSSTNSMLLGAVYDSTSPTPVAGTNGQVFTSSGTNAKWATVSGGTGISVSAASTGITITNTGVASVAVTAPITNTGTATAPNIGLAVSGVAAGSYTLTSLTVDTFGRITAASSGSITSTAWLLAGNTLAANATLGTLNNFDVVMITNNVEAMRLSAANHYVGVGTSTPAVHLDVNGGLRASNHIIGPSSYATGTVSMSGTTTITGVGTTFTSAMVGGLLVFNGGANADQSIMVVAFVSTTVLTGAYSTTIASTNFVLYYGGVYAQSVGWFSSTNAMLLGAVYDSTSPTPVAGTNGQVFTSSGTNAKWATVSGGTGISVSAASSGITITNTGVASVAVTAPITNTGTATAPNIGLAASGVAAGSYTLTSLTVDTFGRITAASSGSVGTTGWLLAGNTVATAGILGTLNNFDVIFYSNNVETMRLDAANNYVGIATATPAMHLDVNGDIKSKAYSCGPNNYQVGTISMSGTTTITGVGTTFTSAMVGGLLVVTSNLATEVSIPIIGFVSTTVLTAGFSATVASSTYRIWYGGSTIQQNGWAAFQNVMLLGAVYDSTSPPDSGTNGQVLVSSGTNVQWASISAGTGISVSASSSGITITNTGGGGGGVSSITAGTGISVNANTGAVTVTNAGVTTAVGGVGIGVSSSTGSVTFTNQGVTQLNTGTGISLSGATGSVTVTNAGVTSIVAGTGISISGGTGTVTITNSAVTGAFYGTVASGGTNGPFTASHGLGSTPRFCSATAVLGSNSNTITSNIWAVVDTITSTQVTGHVLATAQVNILGGNGNVYVTAVHTVMVYCQL